MLQFVRDDGFFKFKKMSEKWGTRPLKILDFFGTSTGLVVKFF